MANAVIGIQQQHEIITMLGHGARLSTIISVTDRRYTEKDLITLAASFGHNPKRKGQLPSLTPLRNWAEIQQASLLVANFEAVQRAKPEASEASILNAVYKKYQRLFSERQRFDYDRVWRIIQNHRAGITEVHPCKGSNCKASYVVYRDELPKTHCPICRATDAALLLAKSQKSTVDFFASDMKIAQ